MKYSFDSKIRFSEIGENGRLSLYQLINYFQDCSNFHAETVGVGLDWYFKNQKAWILTDWQILLGEMPKMSEDVTVSTWAYGFRGFMAGRNFALQSPDGTYLAKANSNWVFMDVTKGSVIRVTQDQVDAYGLHPELKLQDDFGTRKIHLVEGGEVGEPIRMQKFHLDTNHHVNNGQYIQIAVSLLPEGFPLRKVRVEYKKQAFLGDRLFPRMVPIENGYFVALQNEEGEPYCVMEFTDRQ